MNSFLKAFLIRFRFIRFVLLARIDGALGQLGWLQVDFDTLLLSGKDPVPWFSYGAIDFINQTISPDCSVLELGGGGSTRYWVGRGNSVTCIESDEAWSQKISHSSEHAANLKQVIFEKYISPETLGVLRGHKYDVILNDFNGGTGRGSVVTWMVEHLNENGVIIWDNSDRMGYQAGLAELQAMGFGKLSFFGLGPINPYAFETSIFSRGLKSASWDLPIRNTVNY